MTRIKTIVAALSAVGIVTLAAPAYSGEVEDLKAAMQKMMKRIEQLEAQQKQQALAAKAAPAAVPANVVVAGDLPNSIKIPGTNTSVRVYGYAQADATYDLRGRNGAINDYDWASFVAAQPLDNSVVGQRKKQAYFTARTSRLGLETSTPVAGDTLRVKLEGDFNSPAQWGELLTNSAVFRLRHAYGSMGNVLVGQTWSNFLDLDSYAETVDFNGPGSVPQIRQTMFRYNIPMGPSSSLALSVENPQSLTMDGAVNYDKRPDFVANFKTNFKDGHLSLRAVTHEYTTDAHSKRGYGVGIGGSYKLSNNDTLVAQINGGKGIGRYMLNSALQGAYDDGSQIRLWKAVGGHIGYTHAWNEKVRSNLVYAYTKLDGDSVLEALPDQNKNIKEVSVNTFWKLDKNTELGLEYTWGQRTNFDDQKGTQSRVNATARFSLF